MTALGLVVAEFNRPITEQMEQEALEAATAAGAEVYETVRVPESTTRRWRPTGSRAARTSTRWPLSGRSSPAIPTTTR